MVVVTVEGVVIMEGVVVVIVEGAVIVEGMVVGVTGKEIEDTDLTGHRGKP